MYRVKQIELPNETEKAVSLINSLGLSTKIIRQGEDWRITVPRLIKKMLELNNMTTESVVSWLIEKVENGKAVLRITVVNVGIEQKA